MTPRTQQSSQLAKQADDIVIEEWTLGGECERGRKVSRKWSCSTTTQGPVWQQVFREHQPGCMSLLTQRG